jgi:predicted MFS family arabinose efflux permease
MIRQLHASTAQASLALAIFWGMVTAGRILFAVIEQWLPERIVCQILPLLLAAGFIATGWLVPTHQTLGILAFALAGLGCSALLPLVISFGQAQLKTIAASMAGLLIACYQIGYGIAAFGVGPLQARLGLSLGTIYGGTSVVAVALALLAALVARRQTSTFTEKRHESQR